MAKRLRQAAAEAAAAGDQTTSPPASKAEKKKATSSKPAPVASNITDETIAAAIAECGAAKTDLDSAQGIYRNALKKWEERGVPAEHVTWILRQKKREVHDIENTVRWWNRMLKVAQIPVGAQMGLFEDGESVGTKVDKAKAAPIVTDDDIARAKAEGYAAGEKGIGEDGNPHADGSPLALAWASERRRATIDRAGQVFGDKSSEDIAGETVDGMRALRSAEAAGAA